MELGENIKRARKAAGLTQAELAARCGMAAITVRQYESGKRQPRLAQLGEIARALGVELSALTGEAPAGEDEELREYLDMLRTRPECRMLLSTLKSATREEVEANVRFIEALRGRGE